MDARFDFYEIVTIVPSEESPQQLWNADGVIVGRAQDNQGLWEYGVLIFADDNNCWQLKENALRSEGRRMRREDLYNGETLGVRVGPKKGSRSES